MRQRYRYEMTWLTWAWVHGIFGWGWRVGYVHVKDGRVL